jgi:hypothetical protein
MGALPTPFEAMTLGAGYTQTLDVWTMKLTGAQVVDSQVVNPKGVSVWKDGAKGVWRENGVWTVKDGKPRLLRQDHFAKVNGEPVDFADDYLKPFIKRFITEIREVDPDAILFLEGVPGGEHPQWDSDDPGDVINATHWYDALTLFTKHYSQRMTVDFFTRRPVLGKRGVRKAFVRQLGTMKENAQKRTGEIPVLIGEFGLPFDLDDKKAYETGDFSTHVEALDAYYDAMDANLLHCTLWNYTADNTNARGDQWNDEDLSIFSRDQQTEPWTENVHSGGRALDAVVRPYARATAGEPLSMHFDADKRVFEFEFRHDPAVKAPTEIFVPSYQYPNGCEITVSDGTYEMDWDANTLTVHHTQERDTHTIRIRPRK